AARKARCNSRAKCLRLLPCGLPPEEQVQQQREHDADHDRRGERKKEGEPLALHRDVAGQASEPGNTRQVEEPHADDEGHDPEQDEQTAHALHGSCLATAPRRRQAWIRNLWQPPDVVWSSDDTIWRASMQTSSDDTIAVVGGGLAGLATAA